MKKFAAHIRRIYERIGPHYFLSLAMALGGCWVLYPVIQRVRSTSRGDWLGETLHLLETASLVTLPHVVVGLGLLLMAIGILLRARVAWVLSLLLLMAAGALSLLGVFHNRGLFAYSLFLLVLLLLDWRRFHRASVAARGLFALLGVGTLMIYAVFGVLYIGAEYAPPIRDLSTAIYFSIVSMATVGYGDIVPQTATARLFTASIVALGITVFAASISALVAPLISGSLERIVKGRISNVKRKNHYLIVGASPIAHSVYDGLHKRGESVTVLIPAEIKHSYPEDADVLIGDASDSDTLERAGAANARAVLALRSDDSENAFIILAMRALSPQVRVVAMVNESRNLQRLRLLKPDMIFSPQQMAGELLARTLNNETIDNALVSQLLFGVSGSAEGREG